MSERAERLAVGAGDEAHEPELHEVSQDGTEPDQAVERMREEPQPATLDLVEEHDLLPVKGLEPPERVRSGGPHHPGDRARPFRRADEVPDPFERSGLQAGVGKVGLEPFDLRDDDGVVLVRRDDLAENVATVWPSVVPVDLQQLGGKLLVRDEAAGWDCRRQVDEGEEETEPVRPGGVAAVDLAVDLGAAVRADVAVVEGRPC
jgi:hypothetical protein